LARPRRNHPKTLETGSPKTDSSEAPHYRILGQPHWQGTFKQVADPRQKLMTQAASAASVSKGGIHHAARGEDQPFRYLSVSELGRTRTLELTEDRHDARLKSRYSRYSKSKGAERRDRASRRDRWRASPAAATRAPARVRATLKDGVTRRSIRCTLPGALRLNDPAYALPPAHLRDASHTRFCQALLSSGS
jgi:hypothetical protein